MSKKYYSDLEIQEILETLFQEKKKVKDLELKLKSSTLSPSISSSHPQIETQQAEIDRLQKKCEELQELNRQQQQNIELLTHQQKPTDLTELKQREAQLQRVIQFMRKRVEEAHLENQELQQKFNTALLDQEKVECDVQQMKESVQNLSDLLQASKRQNEELQGEEEALKAQLEQLKGQLLHANTALKTKNETLQLAERQSKDQQDALQNSQRETELLKQMMMKTLQEFKEERIKEELRYKNQIETLEATLAQETLQKNSLEKQIQNEQTIAFALSTKQAALTQELADADAKIEEQALAHRELALFTEELKQNLLLSEENRRTTHEALLKKEDSIQSLHAQIASLARSLTEMETSMHQAENSRQEHEAHLRIAQQHLAKRVREATVLAEKNEELKTRLSDLEQALEAAKAKYITAQATLEAESQQKKKINDQHAESIKAIELQATKWEEKYFQLQERWQEAEASNRELKRLEERFGKLQQLISHLGPLLGTPLAAMPQIETQEPIKNVPTPLMKEREIFQAPVEAIQASLFETSTHTRRYKDTLFG